MLSGEMRNTQFKRKAIVESEEEECSDNQDLFERSNDESEREDIDAYTQAKTQMEELSRGAGNGRFNPHPDAIEVQHLRSQYSRLLSEVRSTKSDLMKPDSCRLTDMLTDADSLMDQVKRTTDATMDSRFVALSAELGSEKINKMAMGSVDLTCNDFCTLMRTALGKTVQNSHTSQVVAVEDGFNWSVLGDLAMPYWRGISAPDFFLGPITVEAKEKRQRTRIQREQQSVAPIVQPTVLGADEKTDNQMNKGSALTTNNVILVYQQLSEVAPIPFYKFITDPTSFAKTVENLFYVSFLANDHRVKLYEGKNDGDLILDLVEEEDGNGNDDKENGGDEWQRPKNQRIFAMTMARWRQNISKYTISKPMIMIEEN